MRPVDHACLSEGTVKLQAASSKQVLFFRPLWLIVAGTPERERIRASISGISVEPERNVYSHRCSENLTNETMES